jgi:hypothetical protein
LTRGDPCRQACWGPSQNAHGLKADRMEVDPRRPRGIAVGDPHRGPAGTEPAPLGREPVHRRTAPRPRAGPACRGYWSTPARRARCSPGSGAPRPAAFPRLPVSGPPGRAHRSHDRAQQLVAQLPLAAVADQPGGHRGLDIPTRGLAIHPRPLTRRAQPLPAQPAAQLPESRSPPPPETPLDSSRSLDLNGSVAVAPRHDGVRHAGGPTATWVVP